MRMTYVGYDPCSPILAYFASRPDVTIQRVVSTDQPWGEHVRAIAARHGLPVVHERARKADVARFAADSDLLLCACYDYRLILPAQNSCVFLNVHPTLLPLGRGPTPVQYTLTSEPESAGVTIHVMTDELDAGPIVGQIAMSAFAGEGYESYIHRTNEAAITLLAELNLARLGPRPQGTDHPVSSNPVMPDDRRTITAEMSVRQIERMVAVMGPLGTRVEIDGRWFNAKRAEGIAVGGGSGEAFVNWLYAYYPCADGYCIFPRDGLTPL